MKILFILGAYKPNMSANGVCSDNVIQQLIAEGHQVTVLANAVEGVPDLIADGNLSVKRVKPRWFLRLLEKASIIAEKQPHYSAFLKRSAWIINKAQLFFSAPIWPVVSPVTVYRFSKAAVRLQKEYGFDTVISVYTPIEALLAGYAVKKKYPNIKYVPYFLDALSGGWGPSKWSYQRKERHTRFYEQHIAHKADLLISMGSSKGYHEQHPLDTQNAIKRRYLDVPTLVVSKDIKIKPMNQQTKTLLYSGSISYPQRNPIPLLNVLCELCKIMDVNVIFAGTCNHPEIFQSYFQKTNGRIQYLGQKTHQEILSLAEHTDAFLNIGSTNPTTIACKIFEYMLFQKPIISTYAIDNEPNMLSLEKYGHCFLLDERETGYQETAVALKEYLQNESQANAKYTPVTELFYHNTPAAFTHCLAELWGNEKS